jgi:hypothetical protein
LKRNSAYMIILPNSFRPLAAAGACALMLSLAACTDNSPGGVAPPSIPENASTGPGNAFAPGSGSSGGAEADTGFPSNGGGNGANAPGH